MQRTYLILGLIMLLKHDKLNVNIQTYSGRSLLHEAVAWANPLPIAQLLIERGIDVNLVEENGRTALHELIQYCRKESDPLTEVGEYLIDHGANPNALDNQCRSPLYPYLFIHITLVDFMYYKPMVKKQNSLNAC
jgi:ankyrin repeat protein